MSAVQLHLDGLEAHGHLHAARHDLDQALTLIARAAHNIDAANALQPRDRKGRHLHASALRLWGALNGITTSTRHLRAAQHTCTTFLEGDPS